MPKWLRISVIAGSSLLGVIVLLWLALALYIHLNRQQFLQQITNRLNQRLNGTLSIQDMSPSLLRSFPHVTMELQKVHLQDSLWQQHGHPLLAVQRIFVKVNTFSLLRRRLDIREITLEDGTIYLYTNKEGYTNTSIFTSHKKRKDRSGKDADIARLQLRNILFVLENQQKQKLFRINIYTLKGSIVAADTAFRFDIRTRLQVNDFAFNTTKGSYLKNKILETTLQLNFNRQQQTLSIPVQQIDIDEQPVMIGATFSFGQQPAAFVLNITANNIPFRSAAAMLSPNISQKLDSINLLQPLDLKAQLNGYMRYRDTPHVQVHWTTNNNTLVTKAGEWTNCSFSGDFINMLHPARGHNDENSVVRIYQLKARWWSLPLNADTVQVVNLKHPELEGRFRSEFPLEQLNPLTSETFQFKTGTASANLYYKGRISAGDTLPPHLDGTIQLQNGTMTYMPRNLQLHNCNATIQFSGQDLYFRNVRMQSAKSTIQMDGSIHNILRLYFKAPEKILLDWNIRSPLIDLDEFRFFLARRKSHTHKPAVSSKKPSRLARQLEVVLNACNVNMRLQLDQLNYRRFTAQRIMAELSLTQTDIRLKQISLAHAGGSLQLKGVINQLGNNNRFKLNAAINNVHIDQLFYAFENFDMQSLTSRNLKGLLSARADLTGNLHDNGKLQPRSLHGTVAFDLKQGALVHFAPLEDIGMFFFRKRNLSNITFDNLKNTLHLQGNKIIIPPMQIASSALNMDVSGVYGMPAGTDIYMDVPLRNPQKEQRRNKGIVLHLHATDDNKGGKVKIKLGKKS